MPKNTKLYDLFWRFFRFAFVGGYLPLDFYLYDLRGSQF